MNLNYSAFFLISFIPLIIAAYWYSPNSFITKWSRIEFIKPSRLSIGRIVMSFVLSFTLVYGFINLIIHQMGFYELFFTDIMKGNQEAQQTVDNFLARYGDKHRHFGHGVFHGVINAFVIALPFIGLSAILDGKDRKYVIHHFSFWLFTSAIIGGLISEFV